MTEHTTSTTGPRRWRTSIAPRWGDQDLNNHVNHVVILSLLEDARVRWRSQGGDDGRLWPAVVASLNIDYRSPVEWGPAVDLELWVSRVGRSSFTVSYRGEQEGRHVLDAAVVMVTVAPGGGARTLTDDERAWLGDYLEQPLSAGSAPA